MGIEALLAGTVIIAWLVFLSQLPNDSLYFNF